MNDLDQDLAFSEMARNERFWGEVYRRAFPDMMHSYLNARDNGAQRCGIDRIILLRSTRAVKIDEKVRREDYGDIALEYLSNDRTGVPGWMEKDLLIDYLAYGVLPRRTAYLFPWEMLRRAWVHYRDEWIAAGEAHRDGFKIVRAHNPGYVTLSVAVPLKLLRSKVSAASVIELPAEAA